MAQFRIPGPLRRLSDGQVTVPVEAADLASAIEALDARYPGFRDRLLDEKGELRQFVNVYLNDEDVRLGSGLQEKVGADDEISIVPAVGGGSGLSTRAPPARSPLTPADPRNSTPPARPSGPPRTSV